MSPERCVKEESERSAGQIAKRAGSRRKGSRATRHQSGIDYSSVVPFYRLVLMESAAEHEQYGERAAPGLSMVPLLEVQNLHVAYRARTGVLLPAVTGVSFQVQAGETLGILGESGSGKSSLAAALLRLLPNHGSIAKGAVYFEGQDLLHLSADALEKIRGGRIGLIFQEAALALHPTIRVGLQISEVLAAHTTLDSSARQARTLQLLTALFSAEAQRIGQAYPHQLSGGQRQRILTAQAIACNPALLIADEPTASLDSATQQEILALLLSLREQLHLAMILISHNPAVIARVADRVLVLYAGRVAETGPAQEVLASPRHPYTQGLLGSLPTVQQAGKQKLPAIPGETLEISRVVSGCPFEPRCAARLDACAEAAPSEVTLPVQRTVFCFRYGD